MREVTKEEFFKALYADPRDIMPTVEQPLVCIWRVQRDRTIFGRSFPGWKNPCDPKKYELSESKP